jgi:hypothetical protein
LLDSDPDITIWQCQSPLSQQDLEKLLQKVIVKQKGKYFYIIQYKPDWEQIAENIKIVE